MKINVIFRIASHFVETRVAANKLSSCDDTVFSCVCVLGNFTQTVKDFSSSLQTGVTQGS